MRLEIHKAGDTADDVVIELTEVFPADYPADQLQTVADTEAEALYAALRDGLPAATKAALVRLMKYRPLAEE